MILEKKIDMLTDIREAGHRLTLTRADIVVSRLAVRCIDIEDAKKRIESLKEDCSRIEKEIEEKRVKKAELDRAAQEAENELIVVSADLKSSDLGSKKEHLEELKKTEQDAGGQMRSIGAGSCRGFRHGRRTRLLQIM